MMKVLWIAACLAMGISQAAFAKSSAPSLVGGIGGVFIYAESPAGLAKWYTDKLGIEFQREGDHYYVIFPQADEKFTILTLFPIQGKKSSRKSFMLNLVMNDLDGALRRLKANGVRIEKEEDYDYGRFAWFSDGEGNQIQIWQPKQ
jgi:predicted enzyme related to lactoylglutathione lyase